MLSGEVLQQAVPSVRLEVWSAQDRMSVSVANSLWDFRSFGFYYMSVVRGLFLSPEAILSIGPNFLIHVQNESAKWGLAKI
jgi:hypothetical protein